MTLGTGIARRGGPRDHRGPGVGAAGGEGFPCATLDARRLAAPATATRRAPTSERFPSLPGLGGVFTAGTDTFARGWMQVFSDMARRYGVYILGSNNQSPFRESSTRPRSTRSATPTCRGRSPSSWPRAPRSYNEAFIWAPYAVRSEGPRAAAQRGAQNKKVPLTDIEQVLQLASGPSTGPDAVENLRPYRLPGTRARIGFATSLPAFVYGDPPAGVDPCSDTAKYYMRCLDKLGANLVMQDEANPGPWVTDPPFWQPLDWMRSTWRAASDPTVRFDYNVTPHLVGQLGDLVFDGQTAITQRGLRGWERCTYVGNSRFMPDPPENDAASLEPYAGTKKRVPGARALGGARCSARVTARGAGHASAPPRPTGSRTTTSRPRSRPTSRSRRTAGAATASPRRTAGTSTARDRAQSHRRKRHGMVAPALPGRLERHPAVVHHTLAQLHQRQPGVQSRGHVLAQKVHVRVDRHPLARRVLEVRGHPGEHHEVGMEAHGDEGATGSQEPPRLGVERSERREVVVHETRDHQAVGPGGQRVAATSATASRLYTPARRAPARASPE